MEKSKKPENRINNVLAKRFEFPLQLVVVGRTRSGKSFLLRNHIIPAIIKDYKHIWIFTPTAILDEGWNKLKKKYKKKIELFAEFDNDNILELISEISNSKEEGIKDKYLFIFDDITDRLSQSPSSYFTKLGIFARHYNISYIITSHKFRALNRTLRNNATSKIFFKINSLPELSSVSDENATANITPEELETIINNNTGDYRSFLIQNGPDDDDYFRIEKTGKLVSLK